VFLGDDDYLQKVKKRVPENVEIHGICGKPHENRAWLEKLNRTGALARGTQKRASRRPALPANRTAFR
jgi:hypothetical protein